MAAAVVAGRIPVQHSGWRQIRLLQWAVAALVWPDRHVWCGGVCGRLPWTYIQRDFWCYGNISNSCVSVLKRGLVKL